MKTIQITLPDALAQYMEGEMRSGDYGNASEYIRDLLRADQKRRAKEAMQQTLLAALAEGEAEEAEWWEDLDEDEGDPDPSQMHHRHMHPHHTHPVKDR